MIFFLVLGTIGYNVTLPRHVTLNTERQICSEISLDWFTRTTRSHYLFVTECGKFDAKVSGGGGGDAAGGGWRGRGRRSTTTSAKC